MIGFRRAVASCLALAGCVLAYGQNDNFQQEVDLSSVSKNPELANVRVDQRPGAQLPLGAKFRDETGNEITFGSLFNGRPLVLLPIFYRCTGVCNIELQGVLNALIKSQKLMPGRNLDVVALGINPKEGPDLAMGKKRATLEEYGKPRSADGWHFLTGDMADIRAVTDAMGFRFTYDPGKDVVNHPSGVMVLTPQGQVSAYMLGGTYQPTAFEQDVDRAAASQIAPRSQEIFFGCIHVDPLTGKRSIVIQNVMRLFGIVTVVAIVGGILLLSRRRPVAPQRIATDPRD